MKAVHTPNKSASSAIPVAWAEVPPGSGTITIDTTNEKAVSTASRGIISSCRLARNRLRP
jgi:hypothetical protein